MELEVFVAQLQHEKEEAEKGRAALERRCAEMEAQIEVARAARAISTLPRLVILCPMDTVN